MIWGGRRELVIQRARPMLIIGFEFIVIFTYPRYEGGGAVLELTEMLVVSNAW